MTVGTAPVPPVRMKALLPDARFVGCDDLSIASIATAASRVEPGDVFIANRTADEFEIRTALARGAAGVISERFHACAGHPQVIVDDAYRATAHLAQALAGNPSRRVPTFAVTGTRGKTETAWFLRSIFETDGRECGLIGPEDWSDGRRSRPLHPEPIDGSHVASILAAIADRECAAAVVELGLDALNRRACDGMSLAGAVVGPLDDPRPDIPRPERLAARLLRAVGEDGLILLDADEPASNLLRAVRLEVPVLTFGLGPEADAHAEIESIDLAATLAALHLPGGSIQLRIERPGPGAVRSALAAALMAWQSGVHLDAIRDGIERVHSIPGRLQPIARAPFDIRTDRARTGSEVSRAIRALRDSGATRVHCVAAARYERDVELLQQLAATLEFEADSVFLGPAQGPGDASDAAVDALLAHFRTPGRIARFGDRALAIREAFAAASEGDAVLLLGRGEERSVGWGGAAPLESDAELTRSVLADNSTPTLRKIA